jgi:hypothetical protein
MNKQQTYIQSIYPSKDKEHPEVSPLHLPPDYNPAPAREKPEQEKNTPIHPLPEGEPTKPDIKSGPVSWLSDSVTSEFLC